MSQRLQLARLVLEEFDREQLQYASKNALVTLHKVVERERELKVTSVVLLNHVDRTRNINLFVVLSCGGYHDSKPCKCEKPTFQSSIFSPVELGVNTMG